MTTKNLAAMLAARHKAKRHKPVFVVKESKTRARVEERWRFPGGKHSGVRQKHRGKVPLPSPGYGSPKLVYGLHPSGLKPVLIHTAKALLVLNPTNEGAVVSSTLGAKKKLEVLRLAQEKNIRLLNVKNIIQEIEALTSQFNLRTKAREEKMKNKGQKEEERKKKAEEKKKNEDKKKSAEKEVSEEKRAKLDEEAKKEEQDMAEKTIIKRQ